jgi:hypothetical protein
MQKTVANWFVSVGHSVRTGVRGFQLQPESADISAKRNRETPFLQKPLITAFSRRGTPGSADIAIKKKIKYLTFNFCCVRKEWILK